MQKQRTVTRSGKSRTFAAGGRHDPCVVPRAVPIVEAMTALVLADHFLRQRAVQPGPGAEPVRKTRNGKG
jgi:chorismate synthase